MRKASVGILGATGLVGQRLVERLSGHPWFELVALGASERSAGRTFGEVARWRLSDDPPRDAAGMQVRPCLPEEFPDCDLVFSALDADVARTVEPAFASAGFAVVSNSSAFRREGDVPLLVPEINAAHLEILPGPSAGRGFIVTNPNCAVTGLVLAVAPIHHALGVRRINVVTLQAVSGAGAEGPRALDMLGNVIPFIEGEEAKLEYELTKILGTVAAGRVEPAPVTVSAHCHRVPTRDGHLEAVSLETATPATPDDVARLLADWTGDPASRGLPSAPERPIVVRSEPDRPQPILDHNAAGGMSVIVGRVRSCPVLGLKFELLSHNVVRGAAGCTVMNAELLASRDRIPRRARR